MSGRGVFVVMWAVASAAWFAVLGFNPALGVAVGVMSAVVGLRLIFGEEQS